MSSYRWVRARGKDSITDKARGRGRGKVTARVRVRVETELAVEVGGEVELEF